MKTIITYEDNMANFGSVCLRAFQVGRALGERIPVQVLPLSECTAQKNALIILVKPRQYGKIRKLFGRGNKVIVDLLDTVNLLEQPATLFQKISGTSPQNILRKVDAAIFCSDKTRSHYQHYFKYPELCQTIYHHWDGRLKRTPKPALDSVKVGYFGLHRKAYLANQLTKVEMHDLRSFESLEGKVFNDYNAHYILKPNDQHYQFEPLTKIAIAAFAQSPVISRQGHEEELLGQNYPYYVHGNEVSDILECINKMEHTYRGPLWQDALDVMESVYHRTSLEQVSQQYLTFIQEITG